MEEAKDAKQTDVEAQHQEKQYIVLLTVGVGDVKQKDVRVHHNPNPIFV
jgi:hypothetical protein